MWKQFQSPAAGHVDRPGCRPETRCRRRQGAPGPGPGTDHRRQSRASAASLAWRAAIGEQDYSLGPAEFADAFDHGAAALHLLRRSAHRVIFRWTFSAATGAPWSVPKPWPITRHIIEGGLSDPLRPISPPTLFACRRARPDRQFARRGRGRPAQRDTGADRDRRPDRERAPSSSACRANCSEDRTLVPDFAQEDALSRHALAVLTGQAVGNWTMPALVAG